MPQKGTKVVSRIAGINLFFFYDKATNLVSRKNALEKGIPILIRLLIQFYKTLS